MGFLRTDAATAEAADLPEDRATATSAEALDGLHFDLLEEPQRSRLAKKLSLVVNEFRLDIFQKDSDDHRGLASALLALEKRLHDLTIGP